MYLKGRNGYFFKSFCQILNYRNLKMCDVRLNDNIKRTSGINLEGPSLIRRSQKVWDPPKKWSNCAYEWRCCQNNQSYSSSTTLGYELSIICLLFVTTYHINAHLSKSCPSILIKNTENRMDANIHS